MLVSEVEITTDSGRHRRWSAPEKLRIVEEAIFERESVSAVARRNGVAPNLLYHWCKLMLKEGCTALAAVDSVTRNKTVRDMQARIQELECQLVRKTMDLEILKEVLDTSRTRNRPFSRSR